MICPVCGKPVCPDVIYNYSIEHAIACGLVIESIGKMNCACGDEFVTAEEDSGRNLIVDDFVFHCQQKGHDWPRLLTQRALESM